MEELVKITEQNGRRAVSARELHAFLESKQEFANWIKNRIEKYGFIENQDFEVFDNFIKKPQGGRPLTEYALSIDMAKELSMFENNEKGKQARLEAEKRGKLLMLTTNLSLEEISQKYGERTMDRLVAITRRVKFEGNSLRHSRRRHGNAQRMRAKRIFEDTI